MNFYKRYIGDYQRDTAHLSLMEHGAYTLLLDAMYATGKGLPADLEGLYRICRASGKAERAAVSAVAGQFFPVNGDGSRHNKRATIELERYNEQAETNRAIAEERERKRKENEQSTNRSTNGQPKPEARNHKKKNPSAFALPDWVPAELWQAFEEMRGKRNKKMTDFMRKLALRDLEKLRADGHDIVAVIEEAVLRGWLTFYPLKGAGPAPKADV